MWVGFGPIPCHCNKSLHFSTTTMVRDLTFPVAIFIFSCRQNNVSYDNVDLGENVGSAEIQN
jgi:hypothetical protein